LGFWGLRPKPSPSREKAMMKGVSSKGKSAKLDICWIENIFILFQYFHLTCSSEYKFLSSINMFNLRKSTFSTFSENLLHLAGSTVIAIACAFYVAAAICNKVY
jgi:hypothetical protein